MPSYTENGSFSFIDVKDSMHPTHHKIQFGSNFLRFPIYKIGITFFTPLSTFTTWLDTRINQEEWYQAQMPYSTHLVIQVQVPYSTIPFNTRLLTVYSYHNKLCRNKPFNTRLLTVCSSPLKKNCQVYTGRPSQISLSSM